MFMTGRRYCEYIISLQIDVYILGNSNQNPNKIFKRNSRADYLEEQRAKKCQVIFKEQPTRVCVSGAFPLPDIKMYYTSMVIKIERTPTTQQQQHQKIQLTNGQMT